MMVDSGGGFRGKSHSERSEIEVTSQGNGMLEILVKPEGQWGRYLVFALFAAICASNYYQNFIEADRKKLKERELGLSDRTPPDEDPLYESFLSENDNRRLFPKGMNQDDFEKWKSDRADS